MKYSERDSQRGFGQGFDRRIRSRWGRQSSCRPSVDGERLRPSNGWVDGEGSCCLVHVSGSGNLSGETFLVNSVASGGTHQPCRAGHTGVSSTRTCGQMLAMHGRFDLTGRVAVVTGGSRALGGLSPWPSRARRGGRDLLSRTDRRRSRNRFPCSRAGCQRVRWPVRRR